MSASKYFFMHITETNNNQITEQCIK